MNKFKRNQIVILLLGYCLLNFSYGNASHIKGISDLFSDKYKVKLYSKYEDQNKFVKKEFDKYIQKEIKNEISNLQSLTTKTYRRRFIKVLSDDKITPNLEKIIIEHCCPYEYVRQLYNGCSLLANNKILKDFNIALLKGVKKAYENYNNLIMKEPTALKYYPFRNLFKNKIDALEYSIKTTRSDKEMLAIINYYYMLKNIENLKPRPYQSKCALSIRLSSTSIYDDELSFGIRLKKENYYHYNTGTLSPSTNTNFASFNLNKYNGFNHCTKAYENKQPNKITFKELFELIEKDENIKKYKDNQTRYQSISDFFYELTRPQYKKFNSEDSLLRQSVEFPCHGKSIGRIVQCGFNLFEKGNYWNFYLISALRIHLKRIKSESCEVIFEPITIMPTESIVGY